MPGQEAVVQAQHVERREAREVGDAAGRIHGEKRAHLSERAVQELADLLPVPLPSLETGADDLGIVRARHEGQERQKKSGDRRRRRAGERPQRRQQEKAGEDHRGKEEAVGRKRVAADDAGVDDPPEEAGEEQERGGALPRPQERETGERCQHQERHGLEPRSQVERALSQPHRGEGDLGVGAVGKPVSVVQEAEAELGEHAHHGDDAGARGQRPRLAAEPSRQDDAGRDTSNQQGSIGPRQAEEAESDPGQARVPAHRSHQRRRQQSGDQTGLETADGPHRSGGSQRERQSQGCPCHDVPPVRAGIEEEERGQDT